LKTPFSLTCHRYDGILSQRERKQDLSHFFLLLPLGEGWDEGNKRGMESFKTVS
jgi:hypothetical protein